MLATTILGNIQKMDNQLHQAAETYRRVLELSGDNPIPNAGQVQLNLAEIYYEWNDLETAEQQANQSQELMRQYGLLIDRFILAEAFIARLQVGQGRCGWRLGPVGRSRAFSAPEKLLTCGCLI